MVSLHRQVPSPTDNILLLILITVASFSEGLDTGSQPELELELLPTQMTQKPMLRAEVYSRALRASQNRKEDSL